MPLTTQNDLNALLDWYIADIKTTVDSDRAKPSVELLEKLKDTVGKGMFTTRGLLWNARILPRTRDELAAGLGAIQAPITDVPGYNIAIRACLALEQLKRNPGLIDSTVAAPLQANLRDLIDQAKDEIQKNIKAFETEHDLPVSFSADMFLRMSLEAIPGDDIKIQLGVCDRSAKAAVGPATAHASAAGKARTDASTVSDASSTTASSASGAGGAAAAAHGESDAVIKARAKLVSIYRVTLDSAESSPVLREIKDLLNPPKGTAAPNPVVLLARIEEKLGGVPASQHTQAWYGQMKHIVESPAPDPRDPKHLYSSGMAFGEAAKHGGAGPSAAGESKPREPGSS